MKGKETMAKEKSVLMWTNKYSGERGFVGKLSVKNGHFINAESKDAVKRYPNDGLACADISRLEKMGEAKNNIFTIVSESAVDNFNWAKETSFFK